MKKLIIPFLCFILLAFVSSTGAWNTAVMVGGQTDSYDCDALRGSAKLYWDGDNPSGTLFACISGGTDEATETDSGTNFSIETMSSDPGEDSPNSGYGAKVTSGAPDGFIEWATLGSMNVGSVRTQFRCDDCDSSDLDAYVEYDTRVGNESQSTRIRQQVNGAPKIYLAFGANLGATEAIADDTWGYIWVKWDCSQTDGSDKVAIGVGSPGSVTWTYDYAKTCDLSAYTSNGIRLGSGALAVAATAYWVDEYFFYDTFLTVGDWATGGD